MTNSFADFMKAKMIIMVGTNMSEAHPVAATFVKDAVLAGAQLIVVDPRRTDMVDFADLHVQIKVGSDVALINGIMNVLINENLYDKEYVETCTVGFEELKAKVGEYPPERAAEIAGVPADMIRDLARRLASTKPAMLMYTLGITEHICGVNNVMSCANLQMLLGNVGFECGGVNPLRGQNNVQGACDMGALPNVFPGYQRVDNADARAKFAKAWNVENLPDKPGMMMPTMLENLPTGKVKALYVFGENLANTEPDIRHVEHCLESAEFMVCQDIFPTETTRFADVILPSAAWSENDGTFTIPSAASTVSGRLALPLERPNRTGGFQRKSPAEWGMSGPPTSAREIWDNEVSVLAPSLAGIKYRRLENDGIQWPAPTEDHCGTPTLHKDGKFTCGLGVLKAIDWIPPAEVPDKEYPMVLSTGRRLYHYHTRTQTGRCEGIDVLLGEETADISAADAQKKGILDGELIKVKSRRGEVTVRARVTGEVPEGLVWMAFHFREGNANWLTNPAYDPVTQTAEYKACAVAIEKIQ